MPTDGAESINLDDQGINQQLNWSGGSQHAYLRGRGRGRPKLIGDELDAELVEYIVALKQKTPNLHLTAAQVFSFI